MKHFFRRCFCCSSDDCLILLLTILAIGGIPMEHVGHSIDLGAAEPIKEVHPVHIPSEIRADTLFTFMKEPEHLHTILMKAMISPRYCTEDISYLQIDGISRVSIPMKCFCDINLHRLGKHLACYLRQLQSFHHSSSSS